MRTLAWCLAVPSASPAVAVGIAGVSAQGPPGGGAVRSRRARRAPRPRSI